MTPAVPRLLARLGLPALAAVLLIPSAASAADLQATPSNLSSVFGSAQGGDVIHLAAGSYGSFAGGKKTAMVTLQADSGVSASMAPNFGSASNVRLKNLTLTSAYVGTGASYVEFVGNKFTGNAQVDTANSDMHVLFDGNTHDGINVCSTCYEGRITVKGSGNNTAANGVKITNSHFSGGNSDGVQITGDAFGTQIGPNNTFIDLDQVDSTHNDAIQLYHSHKTLITGNFLYSNETGIMAPDGADRETITGNVITTNGYPWPVVLGQDNGSVITHNTFPDGSCFWSMRCGTVRVYGGNAGVASKGTVVRDNIAGALDVSGSGVAEDHNLVATGTAPGAADIKGQPTFQGGASPTTYNGFLLTSTSLGKSNASDGADRGITSASGTTTPPPAPAPTPAAPATPTISSGPSGSTTATSASFSFTTDDSAATFSCSLDGAASASCSSPKAYSSLATGSHTFSVKATNSTGTSAAATRTWTVTAPATPPAPTTGTTLLGSSTVQSLVDSNSAGSAEAFPATASASGSATKLKVYVGGGTSATSLIAGVYTDSYGHPRSLVTTGTLSSPAKGAWVTVSVPSASLTSGTKYWIALLGRGGRLEIRDRSSSTCKSESSASSALTALPSTWSTGTRWGTCQVSAYATT